MRLSYAPRLLAVAIVGLLAVAAVPADVVEYYASGYVRAVTGTPYPDAAEYDDFIVEFTVDNDASVDSAVLSAEITFFLTGGGEFSDSWTDPTSIMIENDGGMPPFEVWDQVYFTWWSGYEPKLEVSAMDMAAEWLSSSDLPVPWETLPDYLYPYGEAYGEVFYRVNDNQDRAEGQVTDAGIVPEPGSLWLLAVGALGLIRRRG
jgi:hypothetical protein